MGQADLAGPGVGSTADKGHVRNGMVGAAKGPFQDHLTGPVRATCHRVDLVYRDGFFHFQWGQEPHHGAGEHGFAGTRGANHADMMSAGRSDGHGFDGGILAADGSQRQKRTLGVLLDQCGEVALQAGNGNRTGQVVQDVRQVGRGVDRNRGQQGRLGGRIRWKHDAIETVVSANLGQRQCAANRTDLSV